MRFHTRRSFVRLAVGALALAGLSARADEKKDAKGPTGSWAHKERELRLEFADKETLRIQPHGDKANFTIVCGYIQKDGVVKAKITDLEGNAEILEKAKAVLPVGKEFSFTWRVKDDTASLEDLKGENTESIKARMEGEFKKQ